MDPDRGGDAVDALTAAALGARDGNRDAAREFVTSTQRQVWRLLAHLTEAAVAEDLTQETYERAFVALPRFRGDSSARTWLLVIARRVAADHLRRRRRRPAEACPTAEDESPAPDDHAERVALGSLLDALGADRREAFVLTQVLGLDYRETAAVLGCPVGTVRSRVARARDELVELLDETGPAQTG
ncbi:RNA polymerase sigma-70 factor (ECF subfamily) [Actinomycetospora succinea]|uniref:RNA polymerase sigma-70 factor (ECF subfamily) n=1 Tax=Actinomycetospora succinea TaxID=663603 RepID=A0A4R6VKZ4_9PSEU|nr:sigma-70 family RNA polymerase sigma factor [Actinomycetospora succinea]TDQ62552.1 RNA polymerase sigma-70 factor (ECF subfamily) [Actinomycetospora succinea]